MARQRSSEMAELGCMPDISADSATRHQISAELGESLGLSSTMPAAAMAAASLDTSIRPSKTSWRLEVSPAAPPADSFALSA
eukprot:3003431-Prymnesium_polylepis.1